MFFDDAFEEKVGFEKARGLNKYVDTLIRVIQESGSEHFDNFSPHPRKIYTPYGGRYVFDLPQGNCLVIHLKDKDKIQHKKRWSQCMYMYYLLGYKIAASDLTEMEKKVKQENTYILTLDGDVKFDPPAVALLVDLMKKDRNIGAACGRTHPEHDANSLNWITWYQKFEYAIGHWLTKTTEHMFGYVLCSPGCFSLFHADALISNNVMRRFTVRTKAAFECVQYDQGEDRWLCTLLVKKGYRIHYLASSHSYTYCPTDLEEFFKQRKRWIPSTAINIWDLVNHFRVTKIVNENVRLHYVLYQFCLLVTTVIGPGSMFLMLVSAVETLFQVSKQMSMMWNLLSILVYSIICLYCKENTVLKVSKLATFGYACLMIFFQVDVLIQIMKDGMGSPAFVYSMIFGISMLTTGLLHIKEVTCLLGIVVYVPLIPSMYLLLMIYTVTHVDDVSWGTREGIPTPKANKADDNAANGHKPGNKAQLGTAKEWFLSKALKSLPENKCVFQTENPALLDVVKKIKVLEERILALER